MSTFNYKHLYYFWVVANEGGIARAASRLGMAVQTVGTQVHELERELGFALLKPAGRGVALTEAGKAAMQQASLIFQLGEQLPALVRNAASTPTIRLTVGIPDSLPKLLVHEFLQPVVQTPNLHLICHEDEFDRLLGDLALHKIDVILSDRTAPPHLSVKLYSHAMGSSYMAWYASDKLLAGGGGLVFPRSLESVPILLPTTHTAVRARIDAWFARKGIRPRIVGEFEDSASMATFGAAGMGVFPAVDMLDKELLSIHGVHKIGTCDSVQEDFFAIGTEKKVQHPLVLKILREIRSGISQSPVTSN